MSPAPTILKAHQMMFREYLYPTTGRVQVSLRSDKPVDVYLAWNKIADQIRSVRDGQRLNAFVFQGKINIDNEVAALPAQWKEGGWRIIVGNPNSEDAAIYFDVVQV